MSLSESPGQTAAPTSLGWKTLALVPIFYAACVAIATYPMVLNLRSSLPGSLFDPLQHLWIMHWYKTCLLEGRSPTLCPNLQYPVGAAFGSFSPLHLQSLLYLPLSAFIHNDALCFNLIWVSGLLFTGMGTFLLAWYILRDRACSTFAGLVAMLSAPMMLHARCHLELIYVGGFPLFLVAWMRLVDRPGRGRLLAAVGLYLVMAMSAAYYAVFAIFPAALYLGARAVQAVRRKDRPWLRSRTRWLIGFSGLSVPVLALLYANQLWAMRRGYSYPAELSAEAFRQLGAPLWTYIIPSRWHMLSGLLPFDVYEAADIRAFSLWERCSYLGVVPLALLAYAAIHRVGFARARYCWAAGAVLVFLGCGACWKFGAYTVELPMSWLKEYLFAFRMIRVPARFNLFVAVVVAVLAAAGLRHLLARLPGRFSRSAVFAALCLVALADLATVPFETRPLPALPACYEVVHRRDPDAAVLEIPQASSNGHPLYSYCGYWQALHRGRTNAGYAGHGNKKLDDLLTWNSPFLYTRLADPWYPKVADDYLNPSQTPPPSDMCFDVVHTVGKNTVSFNDYAWLYLTAHKFDYIILHKWDQTTPGWPAKPDPLAPGRYLRLMLLLKDAKVYEDRDTVVYERARLRPPTVPVVLTMAGWRPSIDQRLIRAVGKQATLLVYNPDPDRALALALEAKAFRHVRTVRLRSGSTELARWQFTPDRYQPALSRSFRLPAGLHELSLETDSESRPSDMTQAAISWDPAPYSLHVSSVALGRVPSPSPSPELTPELAGQDRTRR